MSGLSKFEEMASAVGLFAVVYVAVLFAASRASGTRGEKIQAIIFILPTFALLVLGLVYPAARTIFESFRSPTGSAFVGWQNYRGIAESPDLRLVLRNTGLWAVAVPAAATAIGLLFAVLVDRARFEAFAKTLVFLPMAISFVGASIIWKFVYEVRPTGEPQIGLLNELLTRLGASPQNFLLSRPLNTLLLIVVMVWIQAGFAMTVLSAAIKAVPQDIVEAARLDGVSGTAMFRYVTLPSIRPAVIVVLTTISIGTLKVFDIVRTMTGGQFGTSVVANEFFNQSFVYDNQGLGAALAVLLFVLVIPVVVYNVRQLRRAESL